MPAKLPGTGWGLSQTFGYAEIGVQRSRLEHLPPRLDQVQVRRVLRSEDELPPPEGQREPEHIHRPVRLQVIADGVDPLDLRREPGLDSSEEVGPVRRAATGIGVRQ